MRASFAAANFNWTAENRVNDAIGDGYVHRRAAAESENGPARAERAICHRDEFATAEQRAGVVLALDVAVGDVHIFATDEMKSVVVADDARAQMDSTEPRISAFDDPHGMKRAVLQENVAHAGV